MLTLRDSPDEHIREAGVQTRTSRKWSASESVNQAENSLKHRDSCRTSMDQCNNGSPVEPIRPEREESVNPVRRKEGRGVYKTSNGRRDGSAWSMD